MQLTKFLSRAGVCSRRQAEHLLAQSRVRVDGFLVKNNFLVEDFNERRITVDEIAVELQPLRIFKYHKPVDEIVARVDKSLTRPRITIYDSLYKQYPSLPTGLVSVGRLDLKSEGLLLLTTSGEMARYLELPTSKIPRIYHVTTTGQVTKKMYQLLEKGLEIDDVVYQPPKIRELGQGRYSIELTEGKNREIRRIFEHFNLPLRRLLRLSYGPYELNNLKPGAIEEVSSKILSQYCLQFRSKLPSDIAELFDSIDENKGSHEKQQSQQMLTT